MNLELTSDGTGQIGRIGGLRDGVEVMYMAGGV